MASFVLNSSRTNTNNRGIATSTYESNQQEALSQPTLCVGQRRAFADSPAVLAAHVTKDKTPIAQFNRWGCIGLLIVPEKENSGSLGLPPRAVEPSFMNGGTGVDEHFANWTTTPEPYFGDNVDFNENNGIAESEWHSSLSESSYNVSEVADSQFQPFNDAIFLDQTRRAEGGQETAIHWNTDTSADINYRLLGNILDQDDPFSQGISRSAVNNETSYLPATYQNQVLQCSDLAPADGAMSSLMADDRVIQEPETFSFGLTSRDQVQSHPTLDGFHYGQPSEPDVMSSFYQAGAHPWPGDISFRSQGLIVDPSKNCPSATGLVALKAMNLKSAAGLQQGEEEEMEWVNTTMIDFASPTQAKRQGTRGQAGRRNGPLDLDVASGAAAMRRFGACTNCRLSKRRCSKDKLCKRYKPSKLALLLSTRQHFSDYTNLFFPQLLVSHLSYNECRALQNKMILRFVNKNYNIRLTFGPKIPQLELIATEFKPVSENPCLESGATAQSGRQISTFIRELPHFLALRDDSKDIDQNFRNYLLRVAKYEKHELKAGITTKENEFSKEVLDAIVGYQRSDSIQPKQTALIETAMMLRIGHMFMDKRITLAEATINISPHTTENSIVIPALLNRQLKSGMQRQVERLTSEVLKDLESLLRTSSRANWATCFCIIAILCVCTESIQITMDRFVLFLESRSNSQKPLFVERDRACLELENSPLGHIIAQFHCLYKAHKPRQSTLNKLNPIRDGVDLADSNGVDKGAVDLVNVIRRIIRKYDDYLHGQDQLPTISCSSMQEHMARQGNARLLSSYLLSFSAKGKYGV